MGNLTYPKSVLGVDPTWCNTRNEASEYSWKTTPTFYI